VAHDDLEVETEAEVVEELESETPETDSLLPSNKLSSLLLVSLSDILFIST
jgi:hypothetical protein